MDNILVQARNSQMRLKNYNYREKDLRMPA